MTQSSIASSRQTERWILLAAAALAAVLFYVFVSARIFRIGFPLDDSWIHLTYARNLAEHGQWAFRLGERSAGSTAPLWTILLAIGFLLGLAPYAWTYFLGWVVLTLVGVVAERIARKMLPPYSSRIPLAGLFFIFAWHLTWSAVSGMETLLHGLLVLAALGALISGSRQYLALGVLAGLSIWVRPDGLTLVAPILFAGLLTGRTRHDRLEAVGKALLGFGALLLPYLLFNLALSGNPLPNTFYAKQAEYEEYWLAKTLAERLMDYVWPVVASPFLVLIPAAAIWLWKQIARRQWGAIASVLWFFGYLGIYFARLPAYQHGRYMIPALPLLYLWGILGFLELMSSPRLNRYLGLVWQISLVTLVVAFQWIAARQNAYDIFWIESQMVTTARWVQENLPSDARLAVHDIGALGYYVENPLVDMAGLITPEVVPFIRDQARLSQFLDAQSVEYLITFPGLYPQLTSGRESLFEAGLKFDALHFEENMQVYSWP